MTPDQSHKDLREKLLREYELQAVVALPQEVFNPMLGFKTSVPDGDPAELIR